MNTPYAHCKAYRIKGGAVVTITRPNGATRRHKVSLARFNWLRQVFGLAASRGWFTSNGFDCRLSEPIGEQVKWINRRW